MGDFDDLLDMEAEMELEQQLDILGSLEANEKDKVGSGSGEGEGGPGPSASLGLTQELEQLVDMEGTAHATETQGLSEGELEELAATQKEEEEEEELEEEEEVEREGPVRYLYQTEGRDHVTVTVEGGRRVYCPVRKDDGGRAAAAAATAKRRKRGGRGGSLIDVPVAELVDRVERRRVQRILRESEDLSKSVVEEGRPAAEGSGAPAAASRQRLLVSKYAPRRFIELLSDERTNREVVRWLKLWDPCVFGREAPKTKQTAAFPSKGDWIKPGPSGDGKRGSRSSAFGAGQGEDLDADGRPAQKVLLFCGPPGFGKTTLAHIAAHQCGYRTTEINASDDRNAATLSRRITDATEMQSMRDPRPTCVVIDEIDGAMGGSEGRGAIGALVGLVTAKRGARGDGGGAEGPAGKGKGGRKAEVLTRPIICICNDLYAPALRPLRDVARVFHFKRPDPRKISARLRRICQLERIQAEGNALGLLCEKSDGDIRAALNTLEFLQRQEQKLSVANLRELGLGVGAKDKVDNVFGAMEKVFNSTSRVAEGEEDEGGRRGGGRARGPKPKRSDQLYHRMLGFGDADLLLTSCFENMAKVRYQDVNLVKTTQACEWFVFADEISKGMEDLSDYSLNKYRAAAPVALGALASAPGRPALTWPKQDGNARYQQRLKASVLQGWLSGLSPHAKSGVSGSSAVLEVIPHLCNALVPRGLRPVAPELMRAKERVTLKRVVDHLVSYGLSLKLNEARMGPDGGYRDGGRSSYSLQPEIDKFHRYDGRSTSKEGIYMNQAVKQIITYELETRKIRERREAGVKESLEDKVAVKGKRGRDAAGGEGKDDEDGARAAAEDHWLGKMRAKVESRLELKRGGRKEGGTICREYAYPMLYTFHEGVTNAVKRRIVLKELF